MEKLEITSLALHKILEAIKAFYKDLEEFDTEDIVNGYFGNIKKEIILLLQWKKNHRIKN